MNRQDDVAALVFCDVLERQTLEEMKAVLLTTINTEDNWPDPESRLGLALIAFTAPTIEKPTEQEIGQALRRVVPLWTQHERARAAITAILKSHLPLFGLELPTPQSLIEAVVTNTEMLQ